MGSSEKASGYASVMFDGSNWSDPSTDLRFSLQYATDFTVGQAWLSDVRYAATAKAIGKLLQSGLAGEAKPVATLGIVDDVVEPGAYYHLSGNNGEYSVLTDPQAAFLVGQ